MKPRSPKGEVGRRYADETGPALDDRPEEPVYSLAELRRTGLRELAKLAAHLGLTEQEEANLNTREAYIHWIYMAQPDERQVSGPCFAAVGDSVAGLSSFFSVAHQHKGSNIPFLHISPENSATRYLVRLFGWEAPPGKDELKVVLVPGAGHEMAELGGPAEGPSADHLQYFVAAYQKGDFDPSNHPSPSPCEWDPYLWQEDVDHWMNDYHDFQSGRELEQTW